MTDKKRAGEGCGGSKFYAKRRIIYSPFCIEFGATVSELDTSGRSETRLTMLQASREKGIEKDLPQAAATSATCTAVVGPVESGE